VRVRSEVIDANPLATKIRDAADAVVCDQFETPGVYSGQHLDWHTRLDRRDLRRREVIIEIDLAAPNPRPRFLAALRLHVADIGETLGMQQLFGDVRRRMAGCIDVLRQTDRGRLRGRLGVERFLRANETRGAR